MQTSMLARSMAFSLSCTVDSTRRASGSARAAASIPSNIFTTGTNAAAISTVTLDSDIDSLLD
ncbi:MAG: hypothetical protein NTW86_32440 [Candidatus Sumerlaeota bacterium]|nr:hypothetical protein [Candidatus Sumerlaeota bacterium]